MVLDKLKWPEDLKVIKPAVKEIFYKGNIDLLFNDHPKLAVVGTRRMTEYASRVIEKWMPVLVNSGITVVSGFMYGVDQKAHQTCMENSGKTIAVLGWGIDRKVARSDIEMYDKILENNGLILSEYEGESAPEKWRFPQRNRIVVGISEAVWVVEGAEKSGSMITAHMAYKTKKKLFALPGPVTSAVAKGTNDLIRRGLATMVTNGENILEGMGLGRGQLELDGIWNKSDPIVNLLLDQPLSADEISRILRLSAQDVLIKLSSLTLNGVIEERSGKFYIL